MTSTTEVPKVVRQLRGAQQLAATLTAVYPSETLTVARELPPEGWAFTAQYVGIDPPPDDTVALTLELLRQNGEGS
ncbi:MAG TPA: hypothetical protein VK611_25105 [Acidimicrobiales bacterium]|nr:hypothetical protein [Acidimicrobiales bacterium]